MHILIVEDEVPVANFIKRIVSEIPAVGKVDTAHSFDEGFEKSHAANFDLILVDIFLGQSGFSGIDLCRSIRRGNPRVPIVILTSSQSLKNLETAFDLGVNDYICKPFRPRELQLRVQRWACFSSQGELKPIIRYNGLTYNPNKNEFTYHGEQFCMTKKNKALLSIFMKKSGQVISQNYIREKLWGDYDFAEKGRNVRSNVHILRQRLQELPDFEIDTVRGEGYILRAVPQD